MMVLVILTQLYWLKTMNKVNLNIKEAENRKQINKNFLYAILRVSVLWLILYFCLSFNALAQPDKQIYEPGLPPGILDRVLALAYIHKLEVQDVQKFIVPLKKAADQDFPVHMMALKIEEGLSKKVSAERIVATLNTMLKQFAQFDEFLNRLPPHLQKNRKKKLHIINRLVAMGITPEEIEARLAAPGKHGPGQLFRAMETKVALGQAGLAPDKVKNIIEQGLESGFFRRPGCWDLAHLVHTASEMGIEAQRVYQISMQIVSDKKSLSQGARELGIKLHQCRPHMGRCEPGQRKQHSENRDIK